jgi:hypothetical protein
LVSLWFPVQVFPFRSISYRDEKLIKLSLVRCLVRRPLPAGAEDLLPDGCCR